MSTAAVLLPAGGLVILGLLLYWAEVSYYHYLHAQCYSLGDYCTLAFYQVAYTLRNVAFALLVLSCFVSDFLLYTALIINVWLAVMELYLLKKLK